MSSSRKADVAIVGAGILGLAHAYAPRSADGRWWSSSAVRRAEGASVRNFGMIWPIGQRAGGAHQMAMRSREIWKKCSRRRVCRTFQPDRCTSSTMETRRRWRASSPSGARPGLYLQVVVAAGVRERSQAVSPEGLRGGIWSPAEMTVDPRVTLAKCRVPRREIRRSVPLRHGGAIDPVAGIEAGTETW